MAKKIALIIRGKMNEAHNPELMSQHADVVVSDGEPVGYFGEGANSTGMFIQGYVYDYNEMLVKRPHYVNSKIAKHLNVVSTICHLEVSMDQAQKFDQFWKRIDREADNGKHQFNIVGGNCSTMASKAFRAAGLLGQGIVGLDTPNHLFRQLKAKFGSRFSCSSGYVGFKKQGSTYKLEVIQ